MLDLVLTLAVVALAVAFVGLRFAKCVRRASAGGGCGSSCKCLRRESAPVADQRS